MIQIAKSTQLDFLNAQNAVLKPRVCLHLLVPPYDARPPENVMARNLPHHERLRTTRYIEKHILRHQ